MQSDYNTLTVNNIDLSQMDDDTWLVHILGTADEYEIDASESYPSREEAESAIQQVAPGYRVQTA